MTIAKTNDFTSDIILGEKYLDEQTGIEGTATSIHFYQHACERVGLEFLKNDGELQEITFDAPRLTLKSTGVQATSEKTGGPSRPGEKRFDSSALGR